MMSSSAKTVFTTAILLSLCLSPFALANPTAVKPRLILQITVDQLRGDVIHTDLTRMEQDGLRYLLENGVVYEDAHHGHSNTETIVGHATLATGAHPSEHGLIGNVWFDRSSGDLRYNIEDARYPLLSSGGDVDQETEVDPTQKVASTDGRSPASMLVSTFSDELAIHTANQAKIFAVSVKDRGAVSMAGHAGKAFWFSKASGEFVTSRFYYQQYPAWVNEFNAGQPLQRYADQQWQLMHPASSYLLGDKDDQPWETALGPYGRVFPHPYGPADGKYFTTLLTLSPAGDELTLDFTRKLIEHENIGSDDVTDYLSVSFSSTDYVGHLFGPTSLESEDNLLRLDRTLAELLRYVDKKVGLENTLIVLSSDHGGADSPHLVNEYGMEADHVAMPDWDQDIGISQVKTDFGIGGKLILQYFPPYVYLNRELINSLGLDQASVEQAVVKELLTREEIYLALSGTALTQGLLPDTPMIRSIINNHNPARSGDIYVVFKPNHFINSFDGLTVTATHGSPWRYDTHVPVIFAGAGIKPQRVQRKIYTVDVATTLSARAGTKQPSAASGQILSEVVGNQPISGN